MYTYMYMYVYIYIYDQIYLIIINHDIFYIEIYFLIEIRGDQKLELLS